MVDSPVRHVVTGAFLSCNRKHLASNLVKIHTCTYIGYSLPWLYITKMLSYEPPIPLTIPNFVLQSRRLLVIDTASFKVQFVQ